MNDITRLWGVRHRLPDRRLSQTYSFEHATGSSSQRYHVTVGFYPDESPGEIFINSSQKAGSEADINANDAAVAVSLALQYGCPISTLCEAVRRNPDGTPQGPLAHALDIMRKRL